MSDTPEYVKRFQQHRTERANFEFRWQQVADYISPSQDFTVKRTPGTDRSAFIYDITARNANEMLIAGLHGLLTSPYMQWFGLTSPQLKTVEDKQYLSSLEKYLYKDVFSDTRTMFNTQMHEYYRDLVTYGTGILQIKFDERTSQIQFRARPLSTCYIQENESGIVDTLYRYALMPVKQVLELYQTPKLIELNRYNPSAKVQILQYCAPRTDIKTYTGGNAQNKPFKNCFYDMTHAEELEESGYDYFPFIVTRFQKRTGEIYGDSPALEALPGVKALNVVNEFGIRGLMKAVDPALQVIDDSILGNSPITQNPGSIIYTRPGSEVKYLLSGHNPTFAIDFIEYLRKDIMRMFHADWFDTPVQPNMTATEFLQRQQEGMRRLSPMLSRIEQEGLSKIIETVVEIAAIHKLFPMKPGLKYDIHYTSPIAQAQAAVEANSLTQTFALYSQLFQLTQSTDPIKHLNLDAIARDAPLDIFKIRPEWMNTLQQVQVIEQAQQEKTNQVQQLQAAQTAAGAAKDAGAAAKYFSESQGARA